MAKSLSSVIAAPVSNKPIETKAAKFFRLVAGTGTRSGRMDKALRALDKLGNCFNRTSYDYTEDHLQKVLSALRQKLNDIEAISRQQAKKRDHFHF